MDNVKRLGAEGPHPQTPPPPYYDQHKATAPVASPVLDATNHSQPQLQSQPQTINQPVAAPVVDQSQYQPNVPTVFFVANTTHGIQGQVQVPTTPGPYNINRQMSRYNQQVVCPYCKTIVMTEIEYVNGTFTHLAACVTCYICICLFCVPYFIDQMKDVEHYCPLCNNLLGYNRRIN